VYNGENSIYRNTEEGCHGIFLLWLAKTRLGKPSCIVNHTAQLDDVRPIMSGMVKLVYPVLDLVAVREPCSLANLHDLGIRNAELFPDVVFAQEPREFSRERVDQWRVEKGLVDQKYFCVSASGLPVSMPRGTWDGEITALVRDLKASGLQAVLVAKDPWCLPLAEVAKRTDSLFFGPQHEFHDLWPLFEGASFLVSGHYHYVIFGAMVGCPFIPLSANNHKMRGVCEHLGWHRTAPFDATLLRSCRAEIVEEARRLRERRPTLRAHLLERSAALQSEARRLGLRVAEVTQRAERAATAASGGAR
jgi:polysaccharide pyruvyl transferase WcaK-like protein